MEKPLFWIIDDEWPDYSVEEAALKAALTDYTRDFLKTKA